MGWLCAHHLVPYINQTLKEAVKAGDQRKLLDAINHGADPRVTVTLPVVGDICLLTYAAREGHTHLLPHLLEAGLSVEGSGQKLLTPLMAAARRGHKQVMEWLLAAGADPHTRGRRGKNICPAGAVLCSWWTKL